MKQPDPGALLSIGELARRSGVPVETLRTWERRYGFPASLRRPSGHRRYAAEVLPQLLLAVQAMEAGLRPRQALHTGERELRDFLFPTSPPPGDQSSPWHPLMEATRSLDSRALDGELRRGVARLGRRRFQEEVLLPFLREMGDLWERGEISVVHEHFASEQVQAILQEQWTKLSASATGESVVCAALPGETHVLPLHLAAWTLAEKGLRVVFLGANTPLPALLEAVQATNSRTLLTRMGPGRDSRATTDLRQLRQELPTSVSLLVGGPGSPRIPGVTPLATFLALEAWTEEDSK